MNPMIRVPLERYASKSFRRWDMLAHLLTCLAMFLGPFLIILSGWALGGAIVKWITCH